MDRRVSKTVLFGGRKQGKVVAERDESIVRRPSPQEKPKKPKKQKKVLKVCVSVVLILAGLYSVVIFSGVPFIKYWREIYIQTAMDTFNHKWLATYFIPGYIIDDVMAEQDKIIQSQMSMSSKWSGSAFPSSSTQATNKKLSKAEFLKEYSEIEATSFNSYIDSNSDLIKNGYEHLIINKARLTDSGTSIKTTSGDQVLAIDAENGVIIVKIKGDGYVGKLAIAKDPSRVKIGVSSKIGSDGQTVGQIAEGNNAVLAINASGFADYQASGNGGNVMGLLIAGGKKYNDAVTGNFLNIGFGQDNRLYIDGSTASVTYRDAIQFFPALVINGADVISGADVASGIAAFGIQPRSALGQTQNGDVLFLTIDGRQPGYSLGCTVNECAKILLKYNAVQATNLDGGSSSIMIFRGEVITKPATSTSDGRQVPNAFMLTYAPGATVAESHIASGHGGYAIGGSSSSSSSSSSDKTSSSSPSSSSSSKPSTSGNASASPSSSAATASGTKPSSSASASPGASPSSSSSASPSKTPSPSSSASASPSPSSTATASPSTSASASPSASPSTAPSPSTSPSPSSASNTTSNSVTSITTDSSAVTASVSPSN